MAFLRRRPKSSPEIQPVEIDVLPPPISSLVAREQSRVRGTITRLKTRPTAGLPSLAVQISDDSGTVTAVWTGRRAIGGLKMGGLIEIEGVPAGKSPRFEFLNPAYTLLPGPAMH